MSPKMYSNIGVGLILAALMVPKMNAMRKGITNLRERMAHFEGLLEGLR